jgi:hypothetical protein
VVGIARTGHAGAFDQGPHWALGLRTNLGFSIVSVIAGAIIVVVSVIGRNIDRNVNFVLGPAFLLMGLIMMAIMRTDANVLNFNMSTCIVSFVIGIVLFSSALYGEVATKRREVVEERQRHLRDPERHGVHP